MSVNLFCGDSETILKGWTGDGFDSLITDTPYGVMLGEVVNGQAKAKSQSKYEDFSDTPEYIKTKVAPIVSLALSMSKRAAITCGNRNAWLYPPPDDIGVWYNPAGSGINKWGFSLAQLILYYGKDPRAGKNIYASSVTGKSDRSGIEIDHPCPKPLAFMRWLVAKASLPGDTIIDPFMGSGTTGVAAVQLGRNFVGIELNKGYFEIAQERIGLAKAQPALIEGL